MEQIVLVVYRTGSELAILDLIHLGKLMPADCRHPGCWEGT